MDNGIHSRTKLLWVEDEAEGGLVERKTYLELTDEYQLQIERYAAEAERIIKSPEAVFDKIVFDIRIPPGSDPFWESQHNNYDGKNSRTLGLILIERNLSIIQKGEIHYGICTIERWQDIKETIMKIDPLFNADRQYIHKDDIAFPEDFDQFIQNL